MKNINFFDDIMLHTWGEDITLDGITNSEKYFATKPKILWILKEANMGEEMFFDQRDFHKNITIYNKWKATYKRICYLSYAIIHNIKDYDGLPDIQNDATINGQYIMDHIAFINVKKIVAIRLLNTIVFLSII